MAKVMFFQYFWMEQLGIMQLSSLLKSKGHQCRVAIGKKKDILKIAEEYKPDVVGFTCFTGQEKWAENVFKGIKKINKNAVTIMGGPHASFFPEVINELDSLDAVCRGEGELAVLDMAECVDKGKKTEHIENFWIKTRKGIVKNPVRHSIENLDRLPFPDRELYKDYPFIYKDTIKHMLSSKGCLFSCKYCFNSTMDELYKEKGCYHRLRSVDNVMEELKKIKKDYKVTHFYFRDGNFINNKKWVMEFLSRYGREIKTPFYCHFVASLIDEEIVKILKSSGCFMTAFGVEAGNEEYRTKILGKHVTNKHIENTALLLHKYKIPFYTTNMMGLPGETLDNAMETVKLNLKIRPFTAWYSMFMPYPKTELTKYACDQNYLKDKQIRLDKANSYKRSLLKQPDIKRVENLHKFTFLLHLFPWFLPIAERLIKLPYNIFYEAMFNITYLWVFVRKSRDWTLPRFFKETYVAVRYYR